MWYTKMVFTSILKEGRKLIGSWEDENGFSQHTKIRTKIERKVEGRKKCWASILK